MKKKLTLSISAIAVVLLISSFISVMEYRSMSTYVSDLIADDVSSIQVAQTLAKVSNQYNLDLLAVIGDDFSVRLPDFDRDYFMTHCDRLRSSVKSNSIKPLADSVMYAYASYMMTSLELEDVMASDFIDTRSWYFERLQPRFNRLIEYIMELDAAIYSDLEKDSRNFDHGFYRSIIPGIVAVSVGIMLVLMLLFFLLHFYVNPLDKMLKSLKTYKSVGKKYSFDFEGDDQLKELNTSIAELCEENQTLRRRIRNNEHKGNQ